MLHSAASDRGLHCLPVTCLGVSSLQWVKGKSNMFEECFWNESSWCKILSKLDEKQKRKLSMVWDFQKCLMIVVGYYGFTLVVRVSVQPSVLRPSIFSFQDDKLSKYNGFSPNLVCALILWRSGLGLLMGKFVNFWWGCFPKTCPYFCFQTITSKCWWIFTKLVAYYACGAFIEALWCHKILIEYAKSI